MTLYTRFLVASLTVAVLMVVTLELLLTTPSPLVLLVSTPGFINKIIPPGNVNDNNSTKVRHGSIRNYTSNEIHVTQNYSDSDVQSSSKRALKLVEISEIETPEHVKRSGLPYNRTSHKNVGLSADMMSGGKSAMPSKVSICPLYPNDLVGNLTFFDTAPSLEDLEKLHSELPIGEPWAPRDCKPSQSVAIIIPFRDRYVHLSMFLQHMHPVLQRQRVSYRVYIIEQDSPALFNRGSLLNVGAVESVRYHPAHTCVILTDVDLLPEDDHLLYRCWHQPYHLGALVSQFGYKAPYEIVGGALAMRPSQLRVVNGFSNTFWGWGGEDDDMYQRLIYHHRLTLLRPDPRVGRMRTLNHTRDPSNPSNPDRFVGVRLHGTDYSSDGLNSLKYKVLEVKVTRLYTKLKVKLLNELDRHDVVMEKIKMAALNANLHNTSKRSTDEGGG